MSPRAGAELVGLMIVAVVGIFLVDFMINPNVGWIVIGAYLILLFLLLHNQRKRGIF